MVVSAEDFQEVISGEVTSPYEHKRQGDTKAAHKDPQSAVRDQLWCHLRLLSSNDHSALPL